ncbi:MAG: carbon-nitrogen hydrolase family protein [Hyphomonadaceae bacterium]|nr:carbon-nitrogen hydrolase family protein [Hyphomonadaceae bacterium]
MNGSTKPFKAGVVQASSCFLDLSAGIEKAIGYIEKASSEGAQLVAFPECWIPGMPWWVSLDSVAWGMQFVGPYFENAMRVDSDEMRALQAAAKAGAITVVIGFVERDHGTLYMAQAIIGADGELISTRRKFRPTGLERSVFGEGDGSDLAVHDTPLGRLGALNCWEHIQPLVKQAMFSQHEQVHVASWPGFGRPPGSYYAMTRPGALACSQVYAIEGQCYVLASAAVLTQELIDRLCDTPEKQGKVIPGGGMAVIIGPDGGIISELLPPDEEGIAYGEIDLGRIVYSKLLADPVGHYSRPDVLQLAFDPAPKSRTIAVDRQRPDQSPNAPARQEDNTPA